VERGGRWRMTFPWLRRLLKDQRGTLAVEMAIAMPILIALLLSGVEVTRFVLLNQKIERASSTMADLTSQAEILAEGDLVNLFTASGYVVEPFDLAADGHIIVSSISMLGTASPVINWQRGFGAGSGASIFGVEGANAVLPTGFVIRDGESVIVAEAFYDFTPIFSGGVMSASTLSRYSILRPRFGALTTLLP